LCIYYTIYTYYHAFFNNPPPTVFYTLSLHDALPICIAAVQERGPGLTGLRVPASEDQPACAGDESLAVRRERQGEDRIGDVGSRSEEHTSELQSPDHLVCRFLLEKKKRRM